MTNKSLGIILTIVALFFFIAALFICADLIVFTVLGLGIAWLLLEEQDKIDDIDLFQK